MANFPGDPWPYPGLYPPLINSGPPPRDLGKDFLLLLKKYYIDEFCKDLKYDLTRSAEKMPKGLNDDQRKTIRDLIESKRYLYSDHYLNL